MSISFKKIFSLCLSLILITTLFVPSYAQDVKTKKYVSILDIKKQNNPLRQQVNNGENGYSNECMDFNDENVHIVRVTYYDKNYNKVKEYTEENALQHLYNVANGYEITSSEYEYKVKEGFVNIKSKTKIIRKNLHPIEDFDAGKFIFDAGLSFAKPVISILSSAISQFLEDSLTYRAGDVQKTEIYRFYQNTAYMKEKYTGEWFPVIVTQKRQVNLKGDFYTADENGELTTFDVNFGKVEENYHDLYDEDDDVLIAEAKKKWNKWPYEHIYKWDDENCQVTDTYNPTPIIVVIEE